MNGVAAFYDLDKSMQMNPNHQLHTQDHQGTIRCLHSWQYPRKPIIIMIALAPPIGIIMDHLFHPGELHKKLKPPGNKFDQPKEFHGHPLKIPSIIPKV